MNSGAITKRYATALLLLTQESGRGDQVCFQVRSMLRNPSAIPSPLEEDLVKFIRLLAAKGRKGYLRRILRTFVDLYCQSAGLRHVTLVTAFPCESVEEQIHGMLQEKLGCRIFMESEVDPDLIGGFRIEVDGKMLDASILRQLQLVRRELSKKYNRIV